jgi:hypothetical protein
LLHFKFLVSSRGITWDYDRRRFCLGERVRLSARCWVSMSSLKPNIHPSLHSDSCTGLSSGTMQTSTMVYAGGWAGSVWVSIAQYMSAKICLVTYTGPHLLLKKTDFQLLRKIKLGKCSSACTWTHDPRLHTLCLAIWTTYWYSMLYRSSVTGWGGHIQAADESRCIYEVIDQLTIPYHSGDYIT